MRRLAALLGAGAIAALLAAIPAATRLDGAADGPLAAWIAVAACALPPATVAVAVLRGARDGLRAFAGEDAPLHAVGFLAWALLTFVAMALLGAVLRKTTHHHGLAGVTFAVVSLATSLGIALVVRRLVVLARGSSAGARLWVGGLGLGATGLLLSVVAIELARAAPGPSPLPASTGAVLVDLLAFAIAVALLSRRVFLRSSLLARAGLPLSVGMFALGVALLGRSPPLRDAVLDRAPALTAAAAPFLQR